MFLIQEKFSNVVSYDHLIKILNSGKTNEYFSSFVLCLVNNIDMVCADLQGMSIENPIKISSKEDLKKSIHQTKASLILNTSGTTGAAKIYTHSVNTLLKNIKVDTKKSVWALTYNPRHMGGVQVILQSITNLQTIVDIYKDSRESILNQLDKYNISHISATPSFYRLLQPFVKTFENVKRVTVGGELSQRSTFEFIKKVFPHAQVNNIYALTEKGACLFSKNEFFDLTDAVEINDKILFIRLNDGSWCNTGDLVERSEEDSKKFKIIGRSSDVVNVGGNNVNLNEVEEVLRSHHEIKDAIVFPKKNSVLGNILACDIVKKSEDLESKDITTFLRDRGFSEYKIPRLINFIKQVQVSENLKTKRS